MSASAVFMFVLGITSSFLPQELLRSLGTSADTWNVLILQVLGALYLGFAILNWSARGVLIGGIYSRPLAFGNFMHFAIVAITAIKLILQVESTVVMVLAAVYVVLAFWFGLVLFTHPGGKRVDP
jgi:hypothetical protein